MLEPRVMVVEPSLFLQHLIKKNLQSLDMQVSHVYTCGSEVLEQSDDHFDMALIDYNLPDMSGTELAEKILHRNIYARIVLLLPESLSRESQEFIAQGVQATLVKPFYAESLQRVLIETIANV